MNKQRIHIRFIRALLLTIFLFVVVVKPLHHLWIGHGAYTKSDHPTIHLVDKQCVLCDYHISAALLVDFYGLPIPVIVLFIFLVLCSAKLVSADVSDCYNKGPPTLA